MDNNFRGSVSLLAMVWIKNNKERLTEAEKTKFFKNLNNFLDGKTENYPDEVFDFFVDVGLVNAPSRHEEYASYLNKKFSPIKFKRVLDVGSGRTCKLSAILSSLGYQMRAIDPNIRISQDEAKKAGIKFADKSLFLCDEFAKNGRGTNILNYDLIVGLEPCDATEHIIRQSLKYDKPFDILLCGSPHKALTGETFENYMAWFEYLSKISSEIEVKKIGGNYHATNSKDIYQPER